MGKMLALSLFFAVIFIIMGEGGRLPVKEENYAL